MNPNAKTELIQSLTGNWLMEPKALGSYMNSIKAGLFDDLLDAVSEQPLRVEDGLAIIGIKGPMSKQSFGARPRLLSAIKYVRPWGVM